MHVSACRAICSRSGSLETHPPSVNSAQPSPNFTPKFTSGWPFFSVASSQIPLSLTLSALLVPSLSSPPHTLMKTYLYTCALSPTQGHSLLCPRTLICSHLNWHMIETGDVLTNTEVIFEVTLVLTCSRGGWTKVKMCLMVSLVCQDAEEIALWPWKNELTSGTYGGLCRHMVGCHLPL